MKKSGELMDRVHALSYSIEEKLLNCEKMHLNLLDRNRELLNVTGELLSETSNGPLYIQERAQRLKALLSSFEKEMEESQSRFSILHRQVGKIKDTILSDYLSPSLNRRIDRFMAKAPCSDSDLTVVPVGYRILYRIGHSILGVRGRVIKQIRNIRLKDSSRVKAERAIEFFPSEESESTPLTMSGSGYFNLMIIEQKDRESLLGLWYEEIASIEKESEGSLYQNMIPLKREHRLIAGKVRRAGEWIYILTEKE